MFEYYMKKIGVHYKMYNCTSIIKIEKIQDFIFTYKRNTYTSPDIKHIASSLLLLNK